MSRASTAPPRAPLGRAHVVFVTACVLAAFAARLVVRLLDGPDGYRIGGYDFYLRIAQTWTEGFGLCVEPAVQCAQRMPLYPMMLAPFVATDSVYPALVVWQAALGALLVFTTWGLTRALFGNRAALVAVVLAAVNPYAVVHDTALQDTVLVNLLVAFGVLLLLHARQTTEESVAQAGYWLGGAVLALAVLTTARVALLLPAAALWALASPGRLSSTALRNAVLITIPAAMLVGGWMARNWTLTGAPILTTESGESFWAANNAWTFEYLPDRSIDLAVTHAYGALRPEQGEVLHSLGGRDREADLFVGRLGWEWVRQHPVVAAWHAVRKAWMPVSARLSPVRSGYDAFGYAAFFMPVHLAACVGMVLTWRRGAVYRLMPVLILAFLGTTAIYWAHTSHKSLIDAFLFAYAAGAVSWMDGWRRRAGASVD